MNEKCTGSTTLGWQTCLSSTTKEQALAGAGSDVTVAGAVRITSGCWCCCRARPHGRRWNRDRGCPAGTTKPFHRWPDPQRGLQTAGPRARGWRGPARPGPRGPGGSSSSRVSAPSPRGEKNCEPGTTGRINVRLKYSHTALKYFIFILF